MSDSSCCPVCGDVCWYDDPTYKRYNCECVYALTVSGYWRIIYPCTKTIQVIDEMKREIEGLKTYIAET
jgi:hypothetical protein